MRHGPPALFLALGALMLLVAAWSAAGTMAFIGHAEHASGHVVDAGPGGRHPLIAFQLAAGQTVQFQGGGIVLSVRAGQPVPVLYASQNPAATARIGWPIPLFFMPGILAIIGAGGIIMVLLSRPGRGSRL